MRVPASMIWRSSVVGALTILSCVAGPSGAMAQRADGPRLQALVDAPGRSPANRARDPFRHPLEDLRFLDVAPTDTVVEILPGGAGYWTEILAPYLRARGRYVAANPPVTDTSEEAVKGNQAFAAKVAADPVDLGGTQTAAFAPGADIVPPGTADVVLTFRNVHNWMADGSTAAVFASFYRALRRGGTLGVEEHRGRGDQPQDPLAKSGYVRQDVVIDAAVQAGFRLSGTSEANANPRDTKDYAAGVWTLPPTYRLKDVDRARYAAIGESDRMLLRFTKP